MGQKEELAEVLESLKLFLTGQRKNVKPKPKRFCSECPAACERQSRAGEEAGRLSAPQRLARRGTLSLSPAALCGCEDTSVFAWRVREATSGWTNGASHVCWQWSKDLRNVRAAG